MMKKMTIIDLLNEIAKGKKVRYSFKNDVAYHDEMGLTDALLIYLEINYGDTEDDTEWLHEELDFYEEYSDDENN